MDPRGAASLGRENWDTWPTYDAAVLGFRDYWYPVAWSAALRKRPLSMTLLGEKVMLVRDADGHASGLRDRCPHRGVPLSLGRQEVSGTWSCIYHGWTYDVCSGAMVACLTDGPDSPLVGKVRVRSYPVEERLGLIWVYFGASAAPPVEDDIPDELIERPVALGGRITERPGNWRYAAENGYDEGHAKYLHRDSLWTLFRRLPAYARASVVPTDDGKWLKRVSSNVTMQADYPVVGTWPRHPWWKGGGRGPTTSIRLPGILRVDYGEWAHYEWYVPIDAKRHRYVQIAAKNASGVEAAKFRARYLAYIGWIFHTRFNDQDAAMVETMEIPPERLYRPDVSIIAWRKMCERPRGTPAELREFHEAEIEALDPANAAD